ncbi:hypothetical protein EV385_0577 [Krasilnikovia cinnamomea]|uniref:Uncharacterized protein n=1 Tax=Krasilnikovia cinnamomea TaxID=349313 RepID=A0A4Q7ZDW9_9ACTN|nr:hypothetical protein [Krasilnikovia cinnamomea]RZU48848.1 hypothetical protein EV385_0577 [Krasilnikovia cinnamomea]
MGEQPMSDSEFHAVLGQRDVRDMNAEQIGELLDNLTVVPTTAAQQAELEALLPPPGEPDAPLNVVRSLRLPQELNQRLDDAAAAQGIPASVFIRRAIESAIAGTTTNLVSLDDVLRAIQSVPKAAA